MAAMLDQDVLVQKAEALVDEMLKGSGKLVEGEGEVGVAVGKTQVSRASEVAQEAPTPRVFFNWLRYQAAREGERQPFWSLKVGTGPDQATLAETLAREINEVAKKQPEAPMLAVRLFMGYFRRALVGASLLSRIKVEG